MSEPWRYRCPQGHTSVRSVQRGGYRCTTCDERYPGDPLDAQTVDGFPVDIDPVAQVSMPELLDRIVELWASETQSGIRARELTERDHASTLSKKLGELRERGLITESHEKRCNRKFWKPTEAGIERARGMIEPVHMALASTLVYLLGMTAIAIEVIL